MRIPAIIIAQLFVFVAANLINTAAAQNVNRDGSNPTSIVVSGSMIFGSASLGGLNGHGTLWSF